MNAFLRATATKEADYTSKVGGRYIAESRLRPGQDCQEPSNNIRLLRMCKTYNCPFDFLLKFSVIR